MPTLCTHATIIRVTLRPVQIQFCTILAERYIIHQSQYRKDDYKDTLPDKQTVYEYVKTRQENRIESMIRKTSEKG